MVSRHADSFAAQNIYKLHLENSAAACFYKNSLLLVYTEVINSIVNAASRHYLSPSGIQTKQNETKQNQSRQTIFSNL